jgi:hypothetical protein
MLTYIFVQYIQRSKISSCYYFHSGILDVGPCKQYSASKPIQNFTYDVMYLHHIVNLVGKLNHCSPNVCSFLAYLGTCSCPFGRSFRWLIHSVRISTNVKSTPEVSVMEWYLIVQVLVNLIRRMQYSAHGWPSEMLLAFQLVQAGTGTSMFYSPLFCAYIILKLISNSWLMPSSRRNQTYASWHKWLVVQFVISETLPLSWKIPTNASQAVSVNSIFAVPALMMSFIWAMVLQ